MFPTNSECLIGISEPSLPFFFLRVSVIFPTCSLYPQQKCAYSALHPQAWSYMYRSMLVGTYRVHSPGFPKIVYWPESSNMDIHRVQVPHVGSWLDSESSAVSSASSKHWIKQIKPVMSVLTLRQFLNSLTAPARKFSGMKSARIHACKQHI